MQQVAGLTAEKEELQRTHAEVSEKRGHQRQDAFADATVNERDAHRRLTAEMAHLKVRVREL